MSLAPGQIALPPPPSRMGLVETAQRPARAGTVVLRRGPGWSVPVAQWRGLWSQRLFLDADPAEETPTADPAEQTPVAGVLDPQAPPSVPGYGPENDPTAVPETPIESTAPTKRPMSRLGIPVRVRRDVPERGPATRAQAADERFSFRGPVSLRWYWKKRHVVDPPTLKDAKKWLLNTWGLTPAEVWNNRTRFKYFDQWLAFQERVMASGFRTLFGEELWEQILLEGEAVYLP